MTDLTTPGATDTSLHLAPDLTFDQWAQIGGPILRTSASSMWWVGDWLLYAEARWATDEHGNEITAERARIRRAVADTASVDVDTLRQARWVAQSIPPARRRTKLPWSSHREVAALAPEVADGLLDQAERDGWSKRELAAAVKAVNVLDVDEAPVDDAPKPLRLAIRLTGTEADHDVLEKLARAAAATVEKQLARRKVTATVEVT